MSGTGKSITQIWINGIDLDQCNILLGWTIEMDTTAEHAGRILLLTYSRKMVTGPRTLFEKHCIFPFGTYFPNVRAFETYFSMEISKNVSTIHHSMKYVRLNFCVVHNYNFL